MTLPYQETSCGYPCDERCRHPNVITATAYTSDLRYSELYLALRSKLFTEIFCTNLWRN